MQVLSKITVFLFMVYSVSVAQEFQVDVNTAGLWHLNESTGSIASDASANGNSGTVNGNTDWSDQGYFNNAMHFDGQSYINIPDEQSLDITDQLTLEAWIYFEVGGTDNPRIVTKEGYSWVASQNSYGLWTDMLPDTNKRLISFSIMTSDLEGYRLQSKTKINKETWNHIAGTYDGNCMRIYINGQLDTTMRATGTINNSSTPVTIGRKYSSYDWFKGNIDEVRISNIARYVDGVNPDLFEYLTSYKGNTYYVSKNVATWHNAKQICEQNGGHLVTISSQAENDIVFDGVYNLNIRTVWIGFTDEAEEGNWSWVTGEDISYTNWDINQPDQNAPELENWATMYGYISDSDAQGKWNDDDDESFRFVLEVERVDPDLFKYVASSGGHDYFISKNVNTWINAKQICEKNGGYLITIANSEENDIAIQAASKTSDGRVWIGFTDVKIEGQWEWVTGEAITFENWYPGQPDNAGGNEDYAILYDSRHTYVGQWGDNVNAGSNGLGRYFVLELDNLTDLDEKPLRLSPISFTLKQNYPNPFNPVTTIEYSLPTSEKVELLIFDAQGRKVLTLVNARQQAGKYSVQVQMPRIASGVYFYKLIAGKFQQVKRMIMLK